MRFRLSGFNIKVDDLGDKMSPDVLFLSVYQLSSLSLLPLTIVFFDYGFSAFHRTPPRPHRSRERGRFRGSGPCCAFLSCCLVIGNSAPCAGGSGLRIIRGGVPTFPDCAINGPSNVSSIETSASKAVATWIASFGRMPKSHTRSWASSEVCRVTLRTLMNDLLKKTPNYFGPILWYWVLPLAATGIQQWLRSRL